MRANKGECPRATSSYWKRGESSGNFFEQAPWSPWLDSPRQSSTAGQWPSEPPRGEWCLFPVKPPYLPDLNQPPGREPLSLPRASTPFYLPTSYSSFLMLALWYSVWGEGWLTRSTGSQHARMELLHLRQVGVGVKRSDWVKRAIECRLSLDFK